MYVVGRARTGKNVKTSGFFKGLESGLAFALLSSSQIDTRFNGSWLTWDVFIFWRIFLIVCLSFKVQDLNKNQGWTHFIF